MNVQQQVRSLIEIAKRRTIMVAPKMVMVNGYVVANSFVEFKEFCFNLGLCSDDFSNWPFIERVSKESVEDRKQYDRDRFSTKY